MLMLFLTVALVHIIALMSPGRTFSLSHKRPSAAREERR